jgi:hypothetical protein
MGQLRRVTAWTVTRRNFLTGTATTAAAGALATGSPRSCSGETQFVAATGNGTRSTVVSVNSQITPTSHPDRFTELRQIFDLAVAAALASD